MMKRAALVLAGFLFFCFSAQAQQPNEPSSPLAFYRPEVLNTMDSSILMRQLPMLGLLDGHRLPLSTPIGRMGMLPVDLSSNTSFNFAQVRATNGPVLDGKDASKTMQPLRAEPLYYSGEVGVFYGHASGKFGGDDVGTYIEGTVGNDKIQITVGGSFEEWNGRTPRWVR